ncbi:MAG: ROK family protein [Clostridia bacterium]|nr:ROK family protein [Clostridia bacterium]
MGRLLLLDVGGTFIKYAVSEEDGRRLSPDSIRQFPTNAEEDAEGFLNDLRSIISQAREEGELERAGLCIGGPFDFATGVSLMEHKFRALYQRSLKPPFDEAGLPISFLHDSTAFMLGEYHEGALQGEKNACCVMLGTGLGFAWVRDGKICLNERQTPSLALWKTPYLDGIAEDYVSTRAIQREFGEALPVKEIATLARSGNEAAQRAFRTMGAHLTVILRDVVARLGCEKFVLGGQISKSADLLGLELSIPWSVAERPDDTALRGICQYVRLGRENCTQFVPLTFERIDAGER